jgi:hypothetical protein
MFGEMLKELPSFESPKPTAFSTVRETVPTYMDTQEPSDTWWRAGPSSHKSMTSEPSHPTQHSRIDSMQTQQDVPHLGVGAAMHWMNEKRTGKNPVLPYSLELGRQLHDRDHVSCFFHEGQ